MIEFADGAIEALAKSAEADGNYERCRALLLSSPRKERHKAWLGEVTYRLAVQRCAQGRLTEAHDLFVEALTRPPSNVVCSLSQERNALLKRASELQRFSRVQLEQLLSTAHIRTTNELHPASLQPEVSLAYCASAYRSAYDRDRNDPLSQLIRLIKHGVAESAVRRLGEFLSAFLVCRTSIAGDIDIVLPVPTRPDRVSERGYSIPRLLAEEIASACLIPLHDEPVRTSSTAVELRHVPRWYRSFAVQGAFETTRKIDWLQGTRVLIVDDVMTTGSTVREVAKIVRSHGAREVHAAALAHTEWSGASIFD